MQQTHAVFGELAQYGFELFILSERWSLWMLITRKSPALKTYLQACLTMQIRVTSTVQIGSLNQPANLSVLM